jgi:hypothetical protein
VWRWCGDMTTGYLTLEPRKLAEVKAMIKARKEDNYSMLRKYGHSHRKAAEITLDFERGDLFAIKWVRYVERELNKDTIGDGSNG